MSEPKKYKKPWSWTEHNRIRKLRAKKQKVFRLERPPLLSGFKTADIRMYYKWRVTHGHQDFQVRGRMSKRLTYTQCGELEISLKKVMLSRQPQDRAFVSALAASIRIKSPK